MRYVKPLVKIQASNNFTFIDGKCYTVVEEDYFAYYVPKGFTLYAFRKVDLNKTFTIEEEK